MNTVSRDEIKEANNFMLTQMVRFPIVINKVIWDMLMHYMESQEFHNVMKLISGDPDAYTKYASSRDGSQILVGVAVSNFILGQISKDMMLELEAIRQASYREQFGQNPMPPVT